MFNSGSFKTAGDICKLPVLHDWKNGKGREEEEQKEQQFGKGRRGD